MGVIHYDGPIRNKYRASPVQLDGHRFASKAEARRYTELRLLERTGEISQVEVHPVVPLVVNGQHVADYIADFLYLSPTGPVLEDVKSPATRTALYRLKKKLVQAIYARTIVEVSYP